MRKTGWSELAGRANSFRYAFAGIRHVMRTQHNAWIHLVISLAVLFLALWLGIPRSDWTLLLLTMTLVWVAEFLNTALEAMVDLLQPDHHPAAKIAKDVAAGAVLLSALGAVAVGLLVLGPPLVDRLAS